MNVPLQLNFITRYTETSLRVEFHFFFLQFYITVHFYQTKNLTLKAIMSYVQAHKIKTRTNTLLNKGKVKTVSVPVMLNEALKAIIHHVCVCVCFSSRCIKCVLVLSAVTLL